MSRNVQVMKSTATAPGRAVVILTMMILGSGCGGSGSPTEDTAAPTTAATSTSANATTAAPSTAAAATAAPAAETTTTADLPATTVPTTAKSDPVAEAVAAAKRWPTRQKLAQLMFIGFNTGFKDTPGTTDPSAAQAVIDAGAGGVFVGRKELELFNSPVLPAAQQGPLPLLVATDGEGGRVDPLPQVADPLPPAREMGTWNPDRIREAAEGHGAQLRAHAVNVNFAPMLDLTGPPEPLGDRTWSSDPATVTATAGAFAEGMCASGVYPTFKHFPGHGHSDVDADYEPATTPDLGTLEAADLLPFRDLTKSMEGRSMIMTGHLDVPGLTTEGRPFSLDPGAMAYLRNNVGFDGVAVTDELAEMGSITQRGIGVDEAIELSLVAGNDMALFFGGPGDLLRVLDRLEGAVADGRLSADRVDEALERVITLKASGACLGSA